MIETAQIQVKIKENGIYDIGLPYGSLVLYVDNDKVEIEQVGHQVVELKNLTKETILASANGDELFCLFHTFLEHLKLRGTKVKVLDQEIGGVISELKKVYTAQTILAT